MTVLLTLETLMLVLLALLVGGLLRSHAEILRRLESAGPPQHVPPEPEGLDLLPKPREQTTPAFDIGGTTLYGDPVKLSIEDAPANTLIAFLSSGCLTCETFWHGLQPAARPAVPGDARVIVVTKDSMYESPTRLRELAPVDIPVVMSSAAWEDYKVPGSPYFVYVDGASGEITGEGSASDWRQVMSLLRDALADVELAQQRGATWGSAGDGPGEPGRRVTRAQQRDIRIDNELLAAGILPDHPSLYSTEADEAEGS